MEHRYSESEQLSQELHTALREMEIAGRECEVRLQTQKSKKTKSNLNHGDTELNSFGGPSPHFPHENEVTTVKSTNFREGNTHSPKEDYGIVRRFSNAVQKIWQKLWHRNRAES